jgi:membrane protease YdiL (CAAX protease family)
MQNGAVTYGRISFLLMIIAVAAATWALGALHPYNALGLVGDLGLSLGASLLVVLVTRREEPAEWRLEDAGRQLRRTGACVVLLYGVMIGSPFVTLPDTDAARLVPRGVHLFFHTGVPLILLASGVWRWPTPLQRPGWRRLAAATAIACMVMIRGPLGDPYGTSSAVGNALALLSTFVAAASEELVYRVMLLSYLSAVLRSPLAALAISSLVFGLSHAPGEIAFWQAPPDLWFRHAAVTHLTLGAVTTGFLYGTLWLRTRSFLAIAICHTLSNVFGGALFVPDGGV